MTAKARTVEDQFATLSATALPMINVWRVGSGQVPQGFSVRGFSKLTLTNQTDLDVEVRRDDARIADLKGRDLVTLTLDPRAQQLVTLKLDGEGEAGGFVVLHDSRFDWDLARSDVEHRTAFSGPTTLALVNHPASDFVVQMSAADGVKARVEPGAANNVVLSAEEARSILLRRSGGTATGKASASGTFCLLREAR